MYTFQTIGKEMVKEKCFKERIECLKRDKEEGGADEEGYKIWQANIDKVINREMAEDEGFFFPIFEKLPFSWLMRGETVLLPY